MACLVGTTWPDSVDMEVVVLTVCPRDRVGVGPLRSFAAQGSKSSLASKWWQSISSKVEHDGHISLLGLFEMQVGRKCSIMYSQLRLAVALQAETVLANQGKYGAKSPFCSGVTCVSGGTRRQAPA